MNIDCLVKISYYFQFHEFFFHIWFLFQIYEFIRILHRPLGHLRNQRDDFGFDNTRQFVFDGPTIGVSHQMDQGMAGRNHSKRI